MLLTDGFCQENQPLLDISSPEYVYQFWKNNSDCVEQLYLQILNSSHADNLKAQAIFFLFYLDRYGEYNIGRNNKKVYSFAKLRSRLAIWPQSWPEFYAEYRLQGLRPEVTQALCLWSNNPDSAVLMVLVPPSRRVLKMQCFGQRPVGICGNWQSRSLPIVDKPSAFDFMTHDLEHLHNFLHDPYLQKIQIGFFRWLYQLAQEIDLEILCKEKWEYLISDMNTHPLHSLAYLRAMNSSIPYEHRINWQKLNILQNMPVTAINDLLITPENAHRPRADLMAYWHDLGFNDINELTLNVGPWHSILNESID